MIWRFSDGTTVSLGGEVEGASLFAQELRYELAQDFVGIQTAPIPAEGTELDRNDPALLDAWLRQEIDRPFRQSQGLRLIDAPAVPALPEQPVQDDDEQGAAPADLVY